MSWPKLSIKSWEHFLKISSHLSYGYPGTIPYLFRGQSDANLSLNPSLLRYLGKNITAEQALAVEADLTREFKAFARQHLDQRVLNVTSSDIHWWALMQHYRAPTRLLDRTSSIYVASYFSVENNWDSDGAIWLFHPKTLIENANFHDASDQQHQMNDVYSNVSNYGAESIVLPLFPETLTSRRVHA